MKSVSRFALGAALALGASSLVSIEAAQAQRAPRPQRQATVQVQGRTLNVSREERTALVALDAAFRGTDRAAQDAALAAAQAVARSADARYATAGYQLEIGRQRGDNRLIAPAIDSLIALGQVAADELPGYLTLQAQFALDARDTPKAERALNQLLTLRPNDANTMWTLARLRLQQNNRPEGIAMLQRAIAAHQASGRPAPEPWHRLALATAYESRQAAQSIALARTLVGAYPSAVNWRDALLIYRELGTLDTGAQVDLWRLMRATGALSGERDYQQLAEALNQAGLPGEAKAVLDEGVTRRMIDSARSPFREMLSVATQRIPADRADLPNAQRAALAAATGTPALRTGDAMLGYGRYADAVALYRAAIQKGGIDANVVNTRIGIAHALAGQRVEAEAAFRAVTGPRADLAAFWLLWLAQPARVG